MPIKIEDSNIAWLGSDLEKEVRRAAAEHEEQYVGAGEKEGIEVWRIEDFAVVRWSEPGTFYNGDSFIVLHTYKKEDSDALLYDVYFWLGTSTTQDEYAVAAYKTVELDDLLGTLPVQHREVQGYESDGFLSLFPKIQILEGGVESGFNHVEPEEYKPRLLHFKGVRGNIRISQVELSRESLNMGDVFLLDAGLKIWQWNGAEAGVWEKRKANEWLREIRDERGGKPEDKILDGLEDDDDFWGLLGGKGDVAEAVGAPEVGDENVGGAEKKLMKVSDASGSLEVTDVEFSKDNLESGDVFIVDGGADIFVWVGSDASKGEKAKSMKYAMDYLNTSGKPFTTRISRVVQGGENDTFNNCFE